MDQDNSGDLLEYAYVFWRRKWLFVFVSTALFFLSVFIIKNLPVVYRSTGTILIEQQDIPEQWVNSTITSIAAERIQAIGQRVFTTEKLEKLIDEFNLFPELREKNVSLDKMVLLTRENFSIDIISRSGTRGRETAAFSVSYKDSSAETARVVTEELVSLYLEENKKSRTLAATDTRRFLEAEADRLEVELADIEGRISTFKENNRGVLPEHQAINIQAYERIEQQIGNINNTLASLDEREVVLEASISSARRSLSTSRATVNPAVVETDPVLRLNSLRSQYASLQTRYSKSHPDLISLQREIKLLEAQPSTGSGARRTVARSSRDDAAIIQLSAELKNTIAEQNSQRDRKKELEEKLASLEVRINKTPVVEQEYRTLIRDHENIQNKYNDIRSKQSSARVSQSLEEEQKGERFTLIEAPRLATVPYSPNYRKGYVIALVLALTGGLGAVFGLEYLSGTIRSARSLELLTGLPVFATVGYIQNHSDRRHRLYKYIFAVVMLILIVLVSLYLIDIYQVKASDLHPKKLMELIRSWVSHFRLQR